MTDRDQVQMNGPGLPEEEILRRLESLGKVPARDPQKVAAARAHYLSMARSLAKDAPQGLPGIYGSWLGPIIFSLQKKEGTPMIKFASAFLLVLVMILGSVGATAYAAQASLPSEPLYGIKAATEDISLDLAGNPQTKFRLALKYINRRGDEIVGLRAQGAPVEAPLMTRLQQQMTLALQQAAGMPDHEMQAALVQYRASLMKQVQKMQRARQKGAPETELQPAVNLFQAHLRIADIGIHEPALFRQQLRSGELYHQPEMPGPAGPPDEIPPSDGPKGPGPGEGPEGPGPAGPPDEIPPSDGPKGPGPAGPPDEIPPSDGPVGPGPGEKPEGPGPAGPPDEIPPSDGPVGPGPGEKPEKPGPAGPPDEIPPSDGPVGPGPGDQPEGPGPGNPGPGGGGVGGK